MITRPLRNHLSFFVIWSILSANSTLKSMNYDTLDQEGVATWCNELSSSTWEKIRIQALTDATQTIPQAPSSAHTTHSKMIQTNRLPRIYMINKKNEKLAIQTLKSDAEVKEMLIGFIKCALWICEMTDPTQCKKASLYILNQTNQENMMFHLLYALTLLENDHMTMNNYTYCMTLLELFYTKSKSVSDLMNSQLPGYKEQKIQEFLLKLSQAKNRMLTQVKTQEKNGITRLGSIYQRVLSSTAFIKNSYRIIDTVCYTKAHEIRSMTDFALFYDFVHNRFKLVDAVFFPKKHT